MLPTSRWNSLYLFNIIVLSYIISITASRNITFFFLCRIFLTRNLIDSIARAESEYALGKTAWPRSFAEKQNSLSVVKPKVAWSWSIKVEIFLLLFSVILLCFSMVFYLNSISNKTIKGSEIFHKFNLMLSIFILV